MEDPTAFICWRQSTQASFLLYDAMRPDIRKNLLHGIRGLPAQKRFRWGLRIHWLVLQESSRRGQAPLQFCPKKPECWGVCQWPTSSSPGKCAAFLSKYRQDSTQKPSRWRAKGKKRNLASPAAFSRPGHRRRCCFLLRVSMLSGEVGWAGMVASVCLMLFNLIISLVSWWICFQSYSS